MEIIITPWYAVIFQEQIAELIAQPVRKKRVEK
jgi:hypothetical protein